MAELVGVVVGLASLALQLADTAVKLKKLCNGYHHAPKKLRHLSSELESLSLLLLELDRRGADSNTTSSLLLTRFIETCREQAESIRALTAKIESSIGRSRVLGKIKAALDEGELRDLCDDLERAKSSLMLACQLFTEARRADDAIANRELVRRQILLLENQGQILERLEDAQGPLITHSSHSQISDDLTSPHEIPAGERAVQRRERSQAASTGKRRGACFSIRFRPWFTKILWDMSAKQAQSGWDVKLRTYNLRPWDSPVFELVRKANLEGIQKLFRAGLASPYDVYPVIGGHWDLLFLCALFHDNLALLRLILQYLGTSHETQYQTFYYALSSPSVPINSRRRDRNELCRLFLEEYGLDLDTHQFYFSQTFALCADDNDTFTTMLRKLPLLYESLPYPVRFRNASFAYGTSGFLRLLALDIQNDPIRDYRDNEGRSILHLIVQRASELHDTGGVNLRLSQMARDVLAAGLDAHAETRNGQTALQMYLSTPLNRKSSSLPTLLKDWVSLLYNPGSDMHAYGEREARLWKPLAWMHLDDRIFWLQSFGYGPTLDSWQLYWICECSVTLFRNQPIPGSWPMDRLVPELSFDIPSEQGHLYTSYRIEICRSDVDYTEISLQRKGTNDHALLVGPDDDSSFIALSMMRSKTSRATSWRRSRSQPRLKKRHSEDMEVDYRQRWWLYSSGVHLCDSGPHLRLAHLDPSRGLRYIEECHCIAGEGRDLDFAWRELDRLLRREHERRSNERKIQELLDGLP